MLREHHQIKPILFKKMMINSHESIQREKENINEINVFPIPDGDTGSNMFYTIQAIVDEVNAISEGSGKDIFQAISKGSFIGAKGNSGVIYSQFLIGVVEYLAIQDEITPKIFSEALHEGTEFAYDSVLHPTEGTILTVMKIVTEEAKKTVNNNPDIEWIEFMEILVHTAQDALEQTKEMLDVLKDAGVVDAGAKGFVHILEAWKEAIEKTQ
ncbi:MAG: DAK2 domain-containing protein [Candidatus Heimdallarchaeaceae archaeon]